MQQVQLHPVRHVDEFTLNGEEAAVFCTLRRRTGAVDEPPGPDLTAAGTWTHKNTRQNHRGGPGGSVRTASAEILKGFFYLGNQKSRKGLASPLMRIFQFLSILFIMRTSFLTRHSF